MLLYIVVIIVSICSLVLVGLISYSKAYKVKNRIINLIEQIDNCSITAGNLSVIKKDINSIGYRVNKNCPESEDLLTGDLGYCVYKKQSGSSCIFKVVTYVSMELPIVGTLTPIPVTGETKTIGSKYVD